MNTPAPDYGEPWQNATYRDGGILSRHGQPVLHAFELAKRAVICTNALAGIEAPAEHLASMNATIEQQAETLRVMNDALKEANRIFGNIGNSQVVQRLCHDFAEVAEKVRKAHDPHA